MMGTCRALQNEQNECEDMEIVDLGINIKLFKS
jgi:hypothetical protein